MKKALFAAGCFWGVEESFRKVPGVIDTEAGYAGGNKVNPTYQEVCTGRTGHAEAVLITFDSKKISYEKLVDFFWKIHDPTTLNSQGPDFGTQYRSAIFYFDNEQKKAAEQSRQKISSSGFFSRPVVTEISPYTTYYRAEEYHQKYIQKNKYPSCH